MIKRVYHLEKIGQLLKNYPVVALLGPRQCGKTTLSREMKPDLSFDTENNRDERQLENPEFAWEKLKSGLIVIDEIQRMPKLFPFLRYWVDNHPQQKFLILGSASRELVNHSSESLAGRIGFWELSGFSTYELKTSKWKELFQRGGFPKSFLAKSADVSEEWRQNYIRTFLEKDIPTLGISVGSTQLRRFWTMLSHNHGNILNFSQLGQSFGLSDHTIRRYVEILESTLMVRLLKPWHQNTKKRLIKRPKVYLRDTGILHSLLNIDDIFSHPMLGASWEGFALENLCQLLKLKNPGLGDEHFFFWGIHAGAELDLVYEWKGKRMGYEIKFSQSPQISNSMKIAIKELQLSRLEILYPGKDSYQLDDKIFVTALSAIDE